MVKRRQNELVSTRKKTPARARKSIPYLCIKLSLLDVKPCLYTIVGWYDYVQFNLRPSEFSMMEPCHGLLPFDCELMSKHIVV